ncbi:hypothetical protein KBD75_00500 [Candidatus Woesebacteria bacterium]|nr:hypothetical protein [Candidatus Woesebacteria bacterium]
MKKFLTSFRLPIVITLIWLATIFLVGLWSIHNLPFTPTFPYYHDLSDHYGRAVSAFSHFDGIHYLRLVHKGYDDTGSQAFFPLYPMLIRLLTFGYFDPLYVSIILNITLTIATLFLVIKNLGHTSQVKFLLLFLSFPTSFYLLANYTESLFIFLLASFFVLLKNRHYLAASVIAGLASGTRLVGAFLSLSLLIELVRSEKNRVYSIFLSLISVTGLLGFMYYLFIRFGDPLMFIHVQSLFSNGRSDGEIILLPQVLFRYFKILVLNSPTTFSYFRSLFELVTFAISLVTLFVYRHKMRLSTLIFSLCAIILPSLSGTLSSYPRYLLAVVPLFIAISHNLSVSKIWLISAVQYAILILSVALFVQGIFIA